MRLAPQQRRVASKRHHDGGKRASFRWKLRKLSVAGLQRVYDRANELGRRDVMNWCMMEAGRRIEEQEVANMPALGYRREMAEGAHAEI